jgi:hypothetical protein
LAFGGESHTTHQQNELCISDDGLRLLGSTQVKIYIEHMAQAQSRTSFCIAPYFQKFFPCSLALLGTKRKGQRLIRIRVNVSAIK